MSNDDSNIDYDSGYDNKILSNSPQTSNFENLPMIEGKSSTQIANLNISKV